MWLPKTRVENQSEHELQTQLFVMRAFYIAKLKCSRDRKRCRPLGFNLITSGIHQVNDLCIYMLPLRRPRLGNSIAPLLSAATALFFSTGDGAASFVSTGDCAGAPTGALSERTV